MAKLSKEEKQKLKAAQKQYQATSAYAVQRFNMARTNLLIAVALTVVNILFSCLNVNMYMLFSISFPYCMFDITDLIWSLPAILVLAGYIVLYLFCKKKPGLMIVTMIAFIFDCLFLVFFSNIVVTMGEGVTYGEFVIDYLTHIWVLVYLIIGTVFTKRYKAAVTEHPELLEGSLFKNADLPPVDMPVEPAAEPVWEEQANTSAETSTEPAWEEQANTSAETSAEPAWDAPVEPAWAEAPADDSKDNQ